MLNIEAVPLHEVSKLLAYLWVQLVP